MGNKRQKLALTALRPSICCVCLGTSHHTLGLSFLSLSWRMVQGCDSYIKENSPLSSIKIFKIPLGDFNSDTSRSSMGQASVISAPFGEGTFSQQVWENGRCVVIWDEGPGHTAVGWTRLGLRIPQSAWVSEVGEEPSSEAPRPAPVSGGGGAGGIKGGRAQEPIS